MGFKLTWGLFSTLAAQFLTRFGTGPVFDMEGEYLLSCATCSGRPRPSFPPSCEPSSRQHKASDSARRLCPHILPVLMALGK